MPALPIPMLGQWSQTASRFRADCGPDCVAMLLAYYGKLGSLTVDKLASETPLAQGSGGLYPVQLAVLGARHGLPLKVNDNTTLDVIRAEIDAGRPVIVLAAYRYILGRLDVNDNKPGSDGHFFVALGYDDSHFVVNDPDTWVDYETFGHNDLIPVTELDRAIAGANYHNQCVFVGEVVMTPLEQARGLAAQLASVLETIHEASETPPEPVTKYATIDQLNIRGGAGTSYPILRKLALGEAVTVVSSAGQWDRVSAPLVGYVFNPSLSVTKPNPT
jgi:hypothetical protein